MQTDNQVSKINTTTIRQHYRKRLYSNGTARKRDRQDLICVVCHAPAMGYNFDQITCESCKAFFRRNALNNADRLKCRTGTNNCIITLESRKRCKYCRLKTCFDKGLRKEWIMSEEEKHRKKQKIEDNRRLRTISQTLSRLSTPSYSPSLLYNDGCNQKLHEISFDENSSEEKYLLTDNNSNSLNGIIERYTRAVTLTNSVTKDSDNRRLRNLIDCIDVINEPLQINALRLITFFKLTPEFNSLHEDDRFTLIKHNLLTVLFIHYSICMDIAHGIFQEPNMPDDFCYQMNELCNYSDSIYHKSIYLTDEMQKLCSYDHLIMKLFMIIAIFSKGVDHIEPILVESKRVFCAQNIYVDLLWNYLNLRFGVNRTAFLFSNLIFSLMKFHSLARETKQTLSKKIGQSNELVPLMQSILQFS